MALSGNYGGMIRFAAEELEEPIAKQFPQTCPPKRNTRRQYICGIPAMFFFKQSV